MTSLTWADTSDAVRPEVRRGLAIAGLIIVVIAAAMLRFHNLGGPSLWADEIFSARTSSLPFDQMWRRIIDDVHPPLYYLLLHLWIRIFGTADAGIRTFSAVLGLLSVLAIAWVTKREYGTRVALLAAAFASTTPILVQYSMEGRMYSLLVLLITLTLGWALAWHRSGKRADGLLFAMALTAALYTHYYTAFVWVGVMAAYSGYLLYREQMGRFMAWVGWNVGPLLAFAAWIPIALRQQASNGPQHWLSLQPRPRLLDVPAFVANCFGIHLGRYTMRLGWGIEPSLLAWGVLTIALLWMVLVTGNRVDSEETAPEDGDRGRLALLVGASLVPILLAWGISQFRNLWADRGLQVIVPALAIVSAIWIASIPRRRWAVAAGAFLLASGAVVSWHVTPKLEPWRETARALRKEVRWGETVAVTAPWTHECLTYYGIRKSQVLPVGAALFDEKEREELRKRGNSTRRLWLVVNRADGTKIDAFLREACGHVRVSERRFGGVLLAAYHRRGPVAKPHPQAAVPVPGPATP